MTQTRLKERGATAKSDQFASDSFRHEGKEGHIYIHEMFDEVMQTR